MAQITSTTGLISGIDSAGLIEQLIALERRPINQVENRNTVLQAQQTALQEVNAQLLSVSNAAGRFTSDEVFEATTAGSSDETVATVSSSAGALPGNYSLLVKQLVSSQQNVTKGFLDATAEFVAPEGGTLTFNRGEARLDRETLLSEMNGGEGVKRGYVRITDRSGNTALVDLTSAVSINDVVDQINQTTAINVFAEVDGDRLVVSDATGQAANDLVIQDVGTSATATGLGLTGTSSTGTIEGLNINTVGEDSFIASLNDGNGLRALTGLDDINVVTRSGNSYDLNLSGFTTLEDLFESVDTATTGELELSINPAGTGLQLTDNTAGGGTLTVSALNDSKAGLDLGLIGTDDNADGVLVGDRVVSTINSKLLRALRGGEGFAALGGSAGVNTTADTLLDDLFDGNGLSTSGTGQADITITDRAGATANINLDALTTVQDLIDEIASATGGTVTATLENNRLTLTDSSGGTGNFTIADASGTTAATDLGLLVDAETDTTQSSTLDAVSAGQDGANLLITNSAGASGSVDLAGVGSVDELIDTINAAGLGVLASLNNAGTGIQIEDTAGGSDPLIIEDDADGVIANQLGIIGTFDDGLADGGSLGFQFVNEGTRLNNLGIARGQFTLQDSDGKQATVDLTQGNEQTIADVLSEINSRGLSLVARVNDTGDGILLEDTGSGALDIVITDDGSSTAADLNIAGTFTAGQDIDGAYRQTVEVSATDTLESLALKINNANVGVNASVINDGSPGAPFRLSLSADKSGTGGAFTFDDGGLGFDTQSLGRAKDAVVFYGGDDPEDALLVTSKTNTLDALIPGVTIDLLSTSDSPIQITVNEDREAITSAVSDFVSSFNGLIDKMNEHDSYNADTEERGLLLGDPTLARLRSAIYNAVIGSNGDLTGRYDSLSEIGVTVGSGAKLRFDQAKFTEALNTDPEAVRDLFTFEQFEVDAETGEDTDVVAAQGVGLEIQKLLADLTDSIDGPVQRQVDIIQSQIDANEGRVERLEETIEDKRARLEREFANLELTLAGLQDSNTALNSLNPVQAPQQ
jgi:flagellar hook-associated protein 2